MRNKKCTFTMFPDWFWHNSMPLKNKFSNDDRCLVGILHSSKYATMVNFNLNNHLFFTSSQNSPLNINFAQKFCLKFNKKSNKKKFFVNTQKFAIEIRWSHWNLRIGHSTATVISKMVNFFLQIHNRFMKASFFGRYRCHDFPKWNDASMSNVCIFP